MVNYRPMGKSELEVSEVGFGVWTLASGRWGSFTDDQAVGLLHKAYDAGINYFQPLPTEGEEALKDDLENAPRFGVAAAE